MFINHHYLLPPVILPLFPEINQYMIFISGIENDLIHIYSLIVGMIIVDDLDSRLISRYSYGIIYL
jgi:hypothetical protein